MRSMPPNARGVTLQVGHNRRRQPANRRIRSMVESGELGTVVQLEGFHSSPGAHKPGPRRLAHAIPRSARPEA